MTKNEPPQSQKKNLPASQKQGGSLPQSEDAFGELQNFYPFGKQEIDFLREYSKDLDTERSLKAAGLKKGALDPHKEQGQALLREMQETQQEWTKSIRLNAPHAAKKHLELMEKFEKDYDSTDLKSANKSGLSGTLARMSDASLKATGHYGQERAGGGTKVEINIDLSAGQETKEPDIKIEGSDG